MTEDLLVRSWRYNTLLKLIEQLSAGSELLNPTAHEQREDCRVNELGVLEGAGGLHT